MRFSVALFVLSLSLVGCEGTNEPANPVSVTRAEYDACGESPVLVVEGRIRSAAAVTVEPATPQGFNPRILILDVRPGDAGDDWRDFTYRQELLSSLYDQVHVRFGGEGAVVDVVPRACP